MTTETATDILFNNCDLTVNYKLAIKDDVTALESARLAQLFALAVSAHVASESKDWGAIIGSMGLARHFESIPL